MTKKIIEKKQEKKNEEISRLEKTKLKCQYNTGCMADKKIGIMDYDKAKCPRCFSSDLDYGAYEPVDECFKQEIVCRSCEVFFTIYCMKPRYWEIWADEGFFHLKVKDGIKQKNTN